MTRPHDAPPPAAQQKLGRLRTKWAALGAAVAVTLGAAGIGGLGIVSAEVSSGDRPVFVPITPCRLVDTRPAPLNTGVQPAPLGPTDTYVIQVRGNTDPCPATIPSDAVGLAMNVTALRATQQTFLTFWGDGANPGTANLNPSPGQPPTPNSVNTPLGSNGSFQMYNDAGTVEVVIDVNGYYVGHNHDDRYVKIGDLPAAVDAYTKAESDGRYAAAVDTYTKSEINALLVSKRPAAITRHTKTVCAADDTAPGEADAGDFESCTITLNAGVTDNHTVMITAMVAWVARSSSPATGECRIERDGVPILNSEVRMGSTISDTDIGGQFQHVVMTETTGTVSGVANYSVACRELVNDMDWAEVTMTALVIPV
ncbi:hypothetical protein [Ilumatobacter coccineus]|uniref:Uncharacterized protein n=1 Tax=Ilumatobacter coccineus (strain NBRC 103263 / KCTC 29153 / YM16-304) TaxID=1313172 RepID=A0A6C7E809_ILUCY|nr:hypothetical protein [Ilumatobacter coccineus]BAN03794.1 hypothetical protein YM304_34800 [Ilumatobacter coccineus YM16-304]